MPEILALISSQIKNIIFDLGGVIINLSPEATVRRFAHLTGLRAEAISQGVLQSDVFKDHERGALSDEDFRTTIRKLFQITCTDQEIDDCWNAMLLDIPPERIALLKHLKKNYRLFLLSNTNGIHFKRFTTILHELEENPTFEQLFEKVYYSHQLLMRKPGKEIFDHVLRENNLQPDETLFLDDNQDNLKGAMQSGIKTFHVNSPDSLFPLFEFKP